MKRGHFLLLLALITGKAMALGTLADIGVYDRTEGKALPICWHDGKAYVVGKPGNEYRIMLRNPGGADVLAVVSVDGVNVITGETAAAGQDGYVLGSRADYGIAGWRKNLSRTAAFYFTDLADSYAARTGRTDNVGVIGVALFRRKVQEPRSFADPAPLAEGEPNTRRPAPAADAANGSAQALREEQKQLGTGHGRSEHSPVRQVTFERATDSPEEIVTIYYDSRANLLARGVILPEPWRTPRPFPARFVVDPPRR